MSAQIGAIAASTLLGVDVILVVANLLLSLRGAGLIPARSRACASSRTGTVFYLIVSIQGSVQAQMAINQRVHFSDWVVGHSHLAMLGFATFAAAGGIIHAWQRIPWARYNAHDARLVLLAAAGGVVIMVSDLTIAGLVEAALVAVVRAVDGFGARGAALLADSHAHASCRSAPASWLLLAGLVTGERGAGLRAGSGRSRIGPSRRNRAAAGDRRLYEPASCACPTWWPPSAGVGFFVMSILLLGVWPGRALEEQIRDHVAEASSGSDGQRSSAGA